VILFEQLELVAKMTGFFEHFYWCDFAEQPWNLFVPIVRLEKLFWRFRFILVEVVKTILTICHVLLSFSHVGFLVQLLDGLVSFTAKNWKITFPDHTSTTLAWWAKFLIAVYVGLSNVAKVIVVRETVTLLAAFRKIQFAFVESLGCLVVGVWYSNDRLRWRFIISWERRIKMLSI